MALESGNFISDFDKSWPTGLDPFNKGDDHLRLVKHVLKTTFPGVDGEGYKEAILATEDDLNNCTSTTGNLQEQIDAIVDTSAFIPVGGIISFNASFANIPANFQLCDGTNGTPNLVDKFIYGTNTESELLDSGGSADSINVSHSHTGTIGNGGNHRHKHNNDNNNQNGNGQGAGGDGSNPSITADTQYDGLHSHTAIIDSSGVSGIDKNIPPYIKLAYIQRMT